MQSSIRPRFTRNRGEAWEYLLHFPKACLVSVDFANDAPHFARNCGGSFAPNTL